MLSWWKLIFTKLKLFPIFPVSPVLPPLIWLFPVPTWSLNWKMNICKIWDYRTLSHAQPCGTIRVFSFFPLFWFFICVILLGKRRFLNSRFILTALKWVCKRMTSVLATATQEWSHMDPLTFLFFIFIFLPFVALLDLICCAALIIVKHSN